MPDPRLLLPPLARVLAMAVVAFAPSACGAAAQPRDEPAAAAVVILEGRDFDAEVGGSTAPEGLDDATVEEADASPAPPGTARQTAASSTRPRPGARASRAVEERATALYERAREDQRNGRYAEAVAGFNGADALVPGAYPKFRAAECLDKLGRRSAARAAYQRFLASHPAPKHADRIRIARERIAALAGP